MTPGEHVKPDPGQAGALEKLMDGGQGRVRAWRPGTAHRPPLLPFLSILARPGCGLPTCAPVVAWRGAGFPCPHLAPLPAKERVQWNGGGGVFGFRSRGQDLHCWNLGKMGSTREHNLGMRQAGRELS